MADYTITDIVDAGALRQLDELAEKFVTVKTSYTDLASELGKNISLPVNSYEDLTNKVSAYVEAQKQMAAGQAEIINILKEYRSVLENANKTTRERVKTVQEGTAATKQASAADREAALEKAKAAQKAREEKQALNLAAREALAYERATKGMTDAEKENVKTLETLSAQYSKLKQQLRSMDVNSGEFKKLSAEAKAVHDEMNRLQMATGNTSLNVGNYTESIQKAIFGNGAFGQSFVRLTTIMQGGGLKAALSEASVAVGAFGKALWALATNPYFLAITAALVAIKGLYEGVQFWVDYNEETAKAKRLTSEFLGVSGEGLREIFADIKAVADVYGKDYTDVLNSVDMLSKQFGITSAEALQVVKDGFAAGADDGGDFLAMIKRFAPVLRDTGLNAKQVAAVMAQTRSGIFNEQGLSAIQMASKRLREMNDSTRESLASIGIDVNKMQENLTKSAEEGGITLFDAIQQVSAKMKELPENSQAVGEVLKDVFGKQGAANGVLLIETLADLETELDKVKEVTGEVGKSQERLTEAAKEYNLALDQLFGMSEGGWEKMKNDIKTTGYRLGTQLIKELSKVYNMFVDLWNASGVLRGALLGVAVAAIAMQKAIWTQMSILFRFITAVVKALQGAGRAIYDYGRVVYNSVTLDVIGAAKAFSDLASSAGSAWEAIKSAGSSAVQGIQSDINGLVNFVEQGVNAVKFVSGEKGLLQKKELGSSGGQIGSEGGVAGFVKNNISTNNSGTGDMSTEAKNADKSAKAVGRAARAAAKAREMANEAANKKIEQAAKEHTKYMEKIYSSLSQVIIQLETDDTTKAILEVQAKYAKLKADIRNTGKTAEEKAAEQELFDKYTLLENRELEQKIGTAATLAIIKARHEDITNEIEKQAKISKEAAMLLGNVGNATANRDGSKSFAITGSIQREYNQMYAQLLGAFENGTSENAEGVRAAAENQITDFLDKYAAEIGKDSNLSKLVDAWAAHLRKSAEEGIAASEVDELAKDGMAHLIMSNDYNAELQMLTDALGKGTITIERFQQLRQDLTEEYANKTIEMQKALLLKQLAVEGLSEEKRLELQQKLAALEKEITEKKISDIEKEEEEAEQKRRARLERTQELIQQMADTVQGFGSFANAMLQSQIDEIDSKSDRLQEAYEAKAAKWDEWVERGAITSEEAEARKRRAEKETEAEQERLAKKKRDLQIKQAKWEKAMNILQTITSTSLGIMKVWAGEGTNTYKIALTAFVAAQGALQLATIMAQKIPEYKHGTDDHKGGLAIVGDAYKSEVVMTDKGVYLTPAVPTLVDLPKHAKVLPDVPDLLTLRGLGGMTHGLEKNPVIVNVENDYRRLEQRMERNTREIRNLQRLMKTAKSNTEYMMRYGSI